MFISELKRDADYLASVQGFIEGAKTGKDWNPMIFICGPTEPIAVCEFCNKRKMSPKEMISTAFQHFPNCDCGILISSVWIYPNPVVRSNRKTGVITIEFDKHGKHHIETLWKESASFSLDGVVEGLVIK
jgi:hypothetical protein